MDVLDAPAPLWPLRVLSMDGGGVRGVITATMLTAIQNAIGKIEKKEVNIKDYFDVIGGTSTGGIISLALVNGMALDEIIELYRKLPETVLAGNSIPYDERPLEDKLKEKFGTNTLASIPETPHVIVTTVREDRDHPHLVLINNYKRDDAKTEFKGWPMWKIARATSAVPFLFQRVDDKYVDGGVMSNSPGMDILTKIYNQEPNPKARANGGIMVSLGTGVVPLNPNDDRNKNPGGMSWYQRVIHLMFGRDIAQTFRLLNSGFSRGPHVVKRTEAWCRMIGMKFHRMDAPVKGDIPWDCKDQDIIEGMIGSTNDFLLDKDNATKIDDIAQRLVSINNQRLAALGKTV